MSFRNNLQHLRATRNMTQEQLAMLLGVSRQSVTKWEAERSYPEMDKLLKLCQIFDCTLDDLVQGDLTDRTPAPDEVAVPAGPPQDVCGYDEHQRKLAWKVPTGIACILVGIAFGFLVSDTGTFLTLGDGTLFILIVLAGILAGLAFIIPAGMDHTAFVKAHPYIEDFYTEDDRLRARKALAIALVCGIAFIFVGIGLFLIFEAGAESYALFFLLLFIAIGAWNIVHYGMLLGRMNIAEYNKSVADELEMEDIVNAQIDEEIKDALISKKRHASRTGAICGAIMIGATIVGLGLLFWPVLTSPDPSNFDPHGTSAMWFWLAWPAGGLLCGIVSLLMNAFARED